MQNSRPKQRQRSEQSTTAWQPTDRGTPNEPNMRKPWDKQAANEGANALAWNFQGIRCEPEGGGSNNAS